MSGPVSFIEMMMSAHDKTSLQSSLKVGMNGQVSRQIQSGIPWISRYSSVAMRSRDQRRRKPAPEELPGSAQTARPAANTPCSDRHARAFPNGDFSCPVKCSVRAFWQARTSSQSLRHIQRALARMSSQTILCRESRNSARRYGPFPDGVGQRSQGSGQGGASEPSRVIPSVGRRRSRCGMVKRKQVSAEGSSSDFSSALAASIPKRLGPQA